MTTVPTTMSIFKSDEGAQLIHQRYVELLDRWPVPNTHLRVPTREGETFMIACGKASAPPMLLMQGSGANSAMWMRDVACWAKHFRVYAVDVIGEPGLSAQTRPPLASDRLSLWLDDVRHALCLPRVTLVGVSLGGWIALDYATRYPACVESLVMISPSGVGRQRASFMWKVVPLMMLGRWGRRRALRMVAGSNATATPSDNEIAGLVSAIFTHFRPRRERVPIVSDDALARLTMPLMLIAGGRDVLLNSYETRERLERITPQVRIRFFPDGGHVLRDQAVPIRDFLKSVHEPAAVVMPARLPQIRLSDHHVHADVPVDELRDVQIRGH